MEESRVEELEAFVARRKEKPGISMHWKWHYLHRTFRHSLRFHFTIFRKRLIQTDTLWKGLANSFEKVCLETAVIVL